MVIFLPRFFTIQGTNAVTCACTSVIPGWKT